MSILIDIGMFIAVWLVTFSVGVFAWSQIIGSFQHFHRGWIITVLFGAALLVGLYFLARWLIAGSWLMWVFWASVAIAFFASLRPQS